MLLLKLSVFLIAFNLIDLTKVLDVSPRFTDDLTDQDGLEINALWVWSDDFSHFFINLKNSDEWLEVGGKDRRILFRFKLFNFDTPDPIIFDESRNMYVKILGNGYVFGYDDVSELNKQVFGGFGGWVIRPDFTQPPSDSCGRQIIKPNSNIDRIVGGQKAVPYSWPWHVLYSVGMPWCGGTIINSEWIVTAAHCIKTNVSTQVFAGIYSTNGLKIEDGIPVAKQIIHEKYNFVNDIALVKLSRPLEFNEKIQPVCLPTKGSDIAKTGVKAYITGWGQLGTKLPGSNVLMEVSAPIQDKSFCYGDSYPGVICAGFHDQTNENNNKGVCFGDSGGPLVVKHDERYVLVGITSYVTWEGCIGRNGFAKVEDYLDWISHTIETN